MSAERPSSIKASHLARKAVAYVRQSTEIQVQKNKGSTDSQRAQGELAIAWGWAREQVDVIDDDLGLSGTSTDHRPGFQRMVQEIRTDQIGILFVSDVSRGGRDSLSMIGLLRDCGIHDTLLCVDGRVFDVADSDEMFMGQLQAILAEHDGRIRRGHLERGRLAKVKAGKTVTHPPAGYLRQPDGVWVKDPNLAVQEAIAAVFRIFVDHRSLRRTVDRLTELKVELPRRSSARAVRWVPATVPAVQSILKNPAYAGSYVWGRRRSDPRCGRDSRGHLRTRKAGPEETIEVANHHDQYISQGQFQEIQMILEGNRWNGPRPGGLGRGSALLQGMVRCSEHRNYKMAPSYKTRRKDGTQPHAYTCCGDYHRGGATCGARPGRLVDTVVVEASLKQLAVPRIEAVRQEWRRAKFDEASEERRHLGELRRAENEIDHLRDRFMTVEPGNRLVRADLEGRLEKALSRLHGMNQISRKLSFDELDETAFRELLELSQNVSAIWSAPTTTDRDRKEILRVLVDTVYVDGHDNNGIDIRIAWIDRQPETRLRVALPAYTHGLILKWAREGLDTEVIAERLNTAGLPTKYCTRWTHRAVRLALLRMRRRP